MPKHSPTRPFYVESPHHWLLPLLKGEEEFFLFEGSFVRQLINFRASAERNDSRPSRGKQPSCFAQVIREFWNQTLAFFSSPQHSFCRFDMIIASSPPAQCGTHHPPGASPANGLVLEPFPWKWFQVKRTRKTSARTSLFFWVRASVPLTLANGPVSPVQPDGKGHVHRIP